jgi:tetratricopeptide (TPR) repeat protein
MKRLGLCGFLVAVVALILFAVWKIQDMSPERQHRLGMEALKAKKPDQAIAHFSRALQLNSNHAPSYIARGSCYHFAHEFDLALADFDRAIKLRPTSARVYRFRGETHWSKGELDLAVADFSKAIELDSKYREALLSRGEVYRDKENLDRALADFDSVLALDPYDAEALVDKGAVLKEKKDYKGAEDCYRAAVEHHQEYARGYNNLAWLLATCPEAKTRIGQKAVAYAKKANDLTSWSDPYYLDTLAAAYAEIGEFDEAIKWMNKALETLEVFVPKDLEKDRKALKLFEARKPFHDD